MRAGWWGVGEYVRVVNVPDTFLCECQRPRRATEVVEHMQRRACGRKKE